MNTGDWAWSVDHQQVCRVLDVQQLWGRVQYQVWLPSTSTVESLLSSRLRPLSEWTSPNPAGIAYVAAAARVADAMNQGLLLAPLRAAVIPLLHQIRVLSRALSGNRVRYLLADEVGLGKTIEAGLILRELKLRLSGSVRRGVGRAGRPGAARCSSQLPPEGVQVRTSRGGAAPGGRPTHRSVRPRR